VIGRHGEHAGEVKIYSNAKLCEKRPKMGKRVIGNSS
jgi:hypothetical protein